MPGWGFVVVVVLKKVLLCNQFCFVKTNREALAIDLPIK